MAKILLLDDDALSLDVLSTMLEMDGFDYRAFRDPIKALATFWKDGPFDAVITDMKMPRLSGTQLIAEIRRINQDVPIIVITASGNREPDQIQFQGFYRKPINIQLLLEHLHTLVFGTIPENNKHENHG